MLLLCDGSMSFFSFSLGLCASVQACVFLNVHIAFIYWMPDLSGSRLFVGVLFFSLFVCLISLILKEFSWSHYVTQIIISKLLHF